MANLKGRDKDLYVVMYPGKLDLLADICFRSTLARLVKRDFAAIAGVYEDHKEAQAEAMRLLTDRDNGPMYLEELARLSRS